MFLNAGKGGLYELIYCFQMLFQFANIFAKAGTQTISLGVATFRHTYTRVSAYTTGSISLSLEWKSYGNINWKLPQAVYLDY
jgi:hypothetical protein